MSGGPVPVFKKYTTGSKGIWEKIRQLLTLVPNRSTGNPLVKNYRVPPPGSQTLKYKDPVTIPAGDIVKNQYYDRDHRRNYPRLVAFDQTKVSGLLTLGSAQNPRISVGEKGQKELAVFDQSVSLSSTLATIDPKVVKSELLAEGGSPVVAPSLNKKMKFRLTEESEHGMYPEDYPIRIFAQN